MIYSVHVDAIAVGGHLDAIHQSAVNVLHEGVAVGCVTGTKLPANNELGISVQGGPGPHATNARLAPHFVGQVRILGIAVAPYLVTLDPAGGQVAQHLILEGQARFA